MVSAARCNASPAGVSYAFVRRKNGKKSVTHGNGVRADPAAFPGFKPDHTGA